MWCPPGLVILSVLKHIKGSVLLMFVCVFVLCVCCNHYIQSY